MSATVLASTATVYDAAGAAPDADWNRRATWLACVFLLSTHVLSFSNFFLNSRPSLIAALAMMALLIWHAPRVLAELTRPAALLITVSLAWQAATLLGYAVRWSHLSYWANASLAANGLSYLLLPQVFFVVLGLTIGRDPRATDRVVGTILLSNVIAIAAGVLFYVLRPGFVLAAESRVFGENVLKYEGFLPRMHGYLNSMVLGAVCYTALGIAAFRRMRPFTLVAVVTLCAVGSILTMQRASWLLTGPMAVFAIALGLRRGAGEPSRPVRHLVLVTATLGLAIGVVAGIWTAVQQQPWFAIAVREFDNRVEYSGGSVAERSDQWVTAVRIVTDRPLGVGLGMVSHKAAQVDGLAPYAATDGNVFRIMAETGLPGVVLFTAIVLVALARAVRARRFDLATVLVLLMAGSVGSNVFDLYYIGFVFWLILGMALGLPSAWKRAVAARA